MPNQFNPPAALYFTQQELGGATTEQETIATVGTTGSVITKGNGDRVGLIFMNVGSIDAYISLNPLAGVFNAITIVAGGGVITMNVRDDFTLPTREWSASSASATTQIYVLEITRYSQQDTTI